MNEPAGRVRGNGDRHARLQLEHERFGTGKRRRLLEQPPFDQVEQLEPERLSASGLVEQARQDLRAVVERRPDQSPFLLVAESLAVAVEELLLGECPARLGLEQEPVAVEDDRRRR